MSSTKSFKDYYNSNPEFRKRHIKKMQEKVKCECGMTMQKSNTSRHRKGQKHILLMEVIRKYLNSKMT